VTAAAAAAAAAGASAGKLPKAIADLVLDLAIVFNISRFPLVLECLFQRLELLKRHFDAVLGAERLVMLRGLVVAEKHIEVFEVHD